MLEPPQFSFWTFCTANGEDHAFNILILSPLDTLQPFDTIEVYTLKHYTNVMSQQQR
jgi:hypothetical protein